MLLSFLTTRYTYWPSLHLNFYLLFWIRTFQMSIDYNMFGRRFYWIWHVDTCDIFLKLFVFFPWLRYFYALGLFPLFFVIVHESCYFGPYYLLQSKPSCRQLFLCCLIFTSVCAFYLRLLVVLAPPSTIILLSFSFTLHHAFLQ